MTIDTGVFSPSKRWSGPCMPMQLRPVEWAVVHHAIHPCGAARIAANENPAGRNWSSKLVLSYLSSFDVQDPHAVVFLWQKLLVILNTETFLLVARSGTVQWELPGLNGGQTGPKDSNFCCKGRYIIYLCLWRHIYTPWHVYTSYTHVYPLYI